jgi:hypothetical protein
VSAYRVIEKPDAWIIACPVTGAIRIPRDGRWEFDGNYERPTFSPSVCEGLEWDESGEKGNWRNHVYIREGRIEYLSDCTHSMAGRTVTIAPLSPEEMCIYYPEAVLES